MSFNGIDLRKHQRLHAELHATVRIIRADESLSPLVLDGMIRNLSNGGLYLALFDMSERDWTDLAQKKSLRPIRVDCVFPTDRRSVHMVGMIVHMEYQGSHANPNCHLGIALDDLESHDRHVMNRFIQAARARLQRSLAE